MLFDGRVNNKEHFIYIAKSFLILFKFCKKTFNKSDQETTDIVITYVAAHQTTMQLIVATLYNIHSLNLIVNKNNIRDIIIESSRLYSPILSIGRVISEDIYYDKHLLKKGDKAIFYTGLANFDSNYFENPFSFNINRKNSPLSFGVGIHKCIGMVISLDFSKHYIEFICNNYQLNNVIILDVIEGVSALGASSFIIEINKNETIKD